MRQRSGACILIALVLSIGPFLVINSCSKKSNDDEYLLEMREEMDAFAQPGDIIVYEGQEIYYRVNRVLWSCGVYSPSNRCWEVDMTSPIIPDNAFGHSSSMVGEKEVVVFHRGDQNKPNPDWVLACQNYVLQGVE